MKKTPSPKQPGPDRREPRPEPGGETVSPVGDGSRDEAIPPTIVPRPSPEPPPGLADHPRYRLVRQLGQGGMGVVYQAEHRLMHRPVALKVISHGLTERPAAVERFRQEVRAAARLAHPNIVTAHDAEQVGDTHFLVMEFVQGTDLARLVQQRGPLPVAQACAFVRQAALGLQHAYERGMVHRDIKPHNLMVTPKGQVKILDFGLARFASETGGGTSLTQSGTMMGTPDYIAPEQALDAHAADIRADLYSLGCTLYFLLTGRAPFPGDTVAQKLLGHQLAQPEPLDRLRPDLPPGLAAVVDKLLEKKPEDRYQTPAEVAAALAPFARRRPAAATQAAPAPAPVVTAPAARRGRPRRVAPWVVAAAVTAVAVGALGTALLLALAVYRVQTDTGELVIETDDPDVQVVIRQNGRQVTIVDTKTDQKIELKAGEYELALPAKADGLRLSTDRLTLHRGDKKIVEVRRRPAPPPASPPGINPPPLPPLTVAVGEVRKFGAFYPHHVAFSPDGRLALVGQGSSQQCIVDLYEVATGKMVRPFLGHAGGVRGNVGFSRDGKLAFSGGEDRNVILWDVATGEPRKRFQGYLAALTPDGRQLVASVGWKEADAVLYDVATGERLRSYHPSDRPAGVNPDVACLALSADGKTLFTNGYDKVGRFWDRESGRELRRCEGEFLAEEAVFSADGRRVLAGPYLIDVATGKVLRCFEDNQPGVYGAALSPDGKRALAGCTDTTVRLWETATGKELYCFRGHEGYVRGVAFAPDGRTALSCGWDNTVRLWRLPD